MVLSFRASLTSSIQIRHVRISWSCSVFELPGVWGLNPPTSSCQPPTSGQNSTPGGQVSTPHLSFAEVGMPLDSHFFLMQFLKYLQCDDLNVTTILIHIED